MAGSTEYRNEKFIQQYEHIRKLELLTDDELRQVKRKRTGFEISIKTATDIKPFIDYIKYEIALMKKFRHMEYEDEDDGKVLDKEMAKQVKDLFRMALKRFQDKRKLWQHYLAFTKQKFPNSVVHIYRDMLKFHRQTEDYIEAAQHEMSRDNYTSAMDFIQQGMANQKESCEKLVVVYIECSVKQGEAEDEKAQEATLLQASKFYAKFLKCSKDISLHCELLQRIQSYNYSMSFQNDVLKNLMEAQGDRAEVWDILAKRHLDGIIYEQPGDEDEEKEKETGDKKIPFDVCLRHAISIYEKSFDAVGEADRQKMFTLCIDKLIELDDMQSLSDNALKIIRRGLGKTLARGYKQDNLSATHFMLCLQLRMIDMVKNRSEIEEMLQKGNELYPHSMEIYELSIKFFIESKDYDNVSATFRHAISNNAKHAIELYRFLCGIYLSSTDDKGKAKTAMLEAINSSDHQLSEAFQPYYIEYCALTESIEKARDAFNQLLKTKTLNSLSLEFFKVMIKLEKSQDKPDERMITSCFERATEHFGKDNPEVRIRILFLEGSISKDFFQIWLDYMSHLWKRGEMSKADDLRNRAMTFLKDDISKVQEFEMKFTVRRNECGMEVDY